MIDQMLVTLISLASVQVLAQPPAPPDSVANAPQLTSESPDAFNAGGKVFAAVVVVLLVGALVLYLRNRTSARS